MKEKVILTALPNRHFLHLYLKTVHEHWPFLIKLSLFSPLNQFITLSWPKCCLDEILFVWLKTLRPSIPLIRRAFPSHKSSHLCNESVHVKLQGTTEISYLQIRSSPVPFNTFWGIKTSPPAHQHSSPCVCHSSLMSSPHFGCCNRLQKHDDKTHTQAFFPNCCFLELKLFLWDLNWKHWIQHNQSHNKRSWLLYGYEEDCSFQPLIVFLQYLTKWQVPLRIITLIYQ